MARTLHTALFDRICLRFFGGLFLAIEVSGKTIKFVVCMIISSISISYLHAKNERYLQERKTTCIPA